MNFVGLLTKLSFLPEKRLIEFFPPFFFMGVKVRHVSEDYRHLHLYLPIRWYGKNMHGSMFGGFISSVSDPMPVLMCFKLFPDAQAWVKCHHLEFAKPARGGLHLKIDISQEEIDSIQTQLNENGQATHDFKYRLSDNRGRTVAEVCNTVFFRLKEKVASTSSKSGQSGARAG